jgi:hypothetical protein
LNVIARLRQNTPVLGQGAGRRLRWIGNIDQGTSAVPGPSKPTLSCLVALAALAPIIAACSSDSGINILPKANFLVPESLSLGSGGSPTSELRPVTAADLVDQQGQCAAPAGPDAAEAGGLVRGGISLQMTECEVVRRAGTPDQIEFGTTDRGGRALTLTYAGGPRPGIYRFADGRVVSIERGPEPPAPPPSAKPKKPVPKKPAPA